MSVRALEYFNVNDILSKHQFGFRKGFSTEYAILDLYEKLLSNLDQKLSTCAIFLDLAKAFDSVDHSILLRKLSKYGIRENFLNFFFILPGISIPICQVRNFGIYIFNNKIWCSSRINFRTSPLFDFYQRPTKCHEFLYKTFCGRYIFMRSKHRRSITRRRS